MSGRPRVSVHAATHVRLSCGEVRWLEYLIGWLALVFSRARDILWVEFAPTGVPASLRLVRAIGPDDWLPVKTLREVRLTHTVVEPYQGDYKPAVSTLALELVLRGRPGAARAPVRRRPAAARRRAGGPARPGWGRGGAAHRAQHA
ncbi:hypothetical protein [Streptomyces sp. NPDC002952]|uniref:hypothetical protein n=1 Tax=Streptomyces sp. NPDC002952 TaxID=3364673 RepID=UPI0036A26EBC